MHLWVKAYSLLFFDYNGTVFFFDYYYRLTVQCRLNLEHKLCNLNKYQIVYKKHTKNKPLPKNVEIPNYNCFTGL